MGSRCDGGGYCCGLVGVFELEADFQTDLYVVYGFVFDVFLDFGDFELV